MIDSIRLVPPDALLTGYIRAEFRIFLFQLAQALEVQRSQQDLPAGAVVKRRAATGISSPVSNKFSEAGPEGELAQRRFHRRAVVTAIKVGTHEAGGGG